MVGKDPNEFSTIKEYTFSSHRGIGFLFGIGKKLDLSKVMFVMNLCGCVKAWQQFRFTCLVHYKSDTAFIC